MTTHPVESEITLGREYTVFSGPDAVRLLQASLLRAALLLYAKTRLQPNAQLSSTRMLTVASTITGKIYALGMYLQAANDLATWIETMASALPIKDETI